MRHDILVLQAVVSLTRDINLMGVFAAAGKADIGHHGFAGTIHDAADDRNRHGRCDVGEAFFQFFDRFDDVEILPRARGAGNNGHASAAQTQRFQNVITDAYFLNGLGGQGYAHRVADTRP